MIETNLSSNEDCWKDYFYKIEKLSILKFMKLLFNPSEHLFDEINNWLIEDKSNFVSNFNTLRGDISKFVFFILDEKPIGFINFTLYDIHAKIDVAVIKKSYQKKGFGRVFLNMFSEFLILKSIVAIELECVPATTKWIWKKLGFKESIEKEISRKEMLKFGYPFTPPSPWLFKPLLLRKNLVKNISSSYIQVWNTDYNSSINDVDSTYKWNISFKLGTNILNKPIIHSVNSEWIIQYVLNGKEIYNGKIKRFNNMRYTGDLLILTELN